MMKAAKNRTRVRTLAAGAMAAMALVLAAGCDSASSIGSGDGGYSTSGEGSGGGSMARFAITGDYLYTINGSRLTVVSTGDPARPVAVDEIDVSSDIETIFPLDTLLFIGSQSAMHIYDVSSPEFPVALSHTAHFRSCDPVVAADTLAFVTLNSSLGTRCGTSGDVLQAYDISNPRYPELIGVASMRSPRGLAVDATERMVFVCDNGLKAYDISDPRNIVGRYTAASTTSVGRIDAYDCIAMGGNRLLVVGSDGLYQLGYNDKGFTFVSKIDLRNE